MRRTVFCGVGFFFSRFFGGGWIRSFFFGQPGQVFFSCSKKKPDPDLVKQNQPGQKKNDRFFLSGVFFLCQVRLCVFFCQVRFCLSGLVFLQPVRFFLTGQVLFAGRFPF